MLLQYYCNFKHYTDLFFFVYVLRGEFFLLCNMRSKLIPTDRIYYITI